MKKYQSGIAVLTFIIVLVLGSCKKHNDQPATPSSPVDTTKTPTLGTLTINLNYPAGGDTLQRKYELIITEADGKLLLDTLSTLNVPIKASLPTNAKLFDVTTVYWTRDSIYDVVTYKAVNPTTWVSAIGGSYAINFGLPTSTAFIYYKNVPLTGDTAPFLDTYANVAGEGISWFPGMNFFGANYMWQPGNELYFYLPTLGLYNLHIPTGQNDTVDCSVMDTVTNINFAFNPGYHTTTRWLTGVLDTTNLTTAITFFDPIVNITTVDVAYPPIVAVQKYELKVSATDGNNTSVSGGLYSYSKTIPKSFTLPDESNFVVSGNQPGNFGVQFNNVSPSWYSCRYGNANSTINWTIVAPPDSTTLYPLPYFMALNPKLLQGQDIASMRSYGFYFETVTGYNYAQYLGLVCNPAAVQTQHVTWATSLSKVF
jgi:hypothetical protein